MTRISQMKYSLMVAWALFGAPSGALGSELGDDPQCEVIVQGCIEIRDPGELANRRVKPRIDAKDLDSCLMQGLQKLEKDLFRIEITSRRARYGRRKAVRDMVPTSVKVEFNGGPCSFNAHVKKRGRVCQMGSGERLIRWATRADVEPEEIAPFCRIGNESEGSVEAVPCLQAALANMEEIGGKQAASIEVEAIDEEYVLTATLLHASP